MSGMIAVVSSDPTDAEWIARAVGPAIEVIAANEVVSVLARCDGEAVLVVSADHAAATLASIDTLPTPPPLLVLGEPGAGPHDPRVAHIVRRQLPSDQLRDLLRCLLDGHPIHSHADRAPQTPVEARRVQLAFNASRRLAGASELASTERIAADAVLELVDADRATCLFHDVGDGAMWSEAKLRGSTGDDRRAVAGLAGWSALTGLPARTSRAAEDPRWVPEIDDPDPSAQLLTQPIIGADGHCHAILIAMRRARRSEFGDAEAALLARFAGLAAPLFDQLSIHIQSQAILDEAAGDPGIFRKEALEAATLPTWGDVVRVLPSWLPRTYWVLVVLLIGSTIFVTVGTIPTYSSGLAVIHSKSRTMITSRAAGNVVSVVASGDKVPAGGEIARLDDAEPRAAVDRLSHELDTQLRNRLLDPGATAATSAILQLRQELDAARTAVEQRRILASTDVVIGDVRVQPGQQVKPGDIIAVAQGSGDLEVIALLPGADRPQLSPGMALRFELGGYRYNYRSLTVDSVSPDVLSPSEAKRVLGPEIGNDLPLLGPVVLVKAKLPSAEFEADGVVQRMHDGMFGAADVRVRSERIIFAVVPGLRRF